MTKNKTRLPGILFVSLVSIPAWLLGNHFPVVGSPVLGILSGMLLAFYKRPENLEQGISFTAKKLLQYSIILLGFGLNLLVIFKVGRQTILLMAFTLTATFLSAFLLGKLFKVERNTTILIGVGTAICGGSAIAATAPVIHAKEDEVARSISTIFLFNVIAAFLFPFLGHCMHLTNYEFGLWAGTAVNDTSSVVAAAYTFSDAAGDFAVIVKLTRTLMIIPVTLALAFSLSRKQAHACKLEYSFRNIFPWFVLGFLATSMMSTFLPLPPVVIEFLVRIGKYIIVMAMTAIGLNTNLLSLIKNGLSPILLGLGCWLILSVTSLLLQLLI
jgi:uncharacterized integral membrane protein (TIGR00698 family)